VKGKINEEYFLKIKKTGGIKVDIKAQPWLRWLVVICNLS
jgi:hypothetical protein